jgi:asparagine synthase (glutamine-hydrolysing)
LVFASEPKTILASGLVPRAMRTTSMVDYFTFRAPRSPASLVESIHKFPAGSWCRYEPRDGLGTPVRFWAPRPAPNELGSVREAEERVAQELERAVVARKMADVPVGVFLSGGVDSSLVAAALSRHVKLDAFTIGSDGPLDETEYARVVADRLGMKLHARRVDGSDFVDRFDDWVYYNDDPVSDPSALALMVLAQYARDSGMKVMLAGEGSDEIFGGYNAYLRYAVFHGLSRIPGSGVVGARAARGKASRNADYLRTLRGVRFMGAAHLTDAVTRRRLFVDELTPALDDLERNGFAPVVPGAGPLRQAMLFDQTLRLPDDLLARTDRATMAVSLETRVPFMDHRLVELANTLPDRWCVRLRGFTGKWLLKRILARLVPREVVYRPKRGFDLPVGDWLRTEFSELIRTNLSEQALPGLDYVFLTQAYDDVYDGAGSYEALIWGWLVLEKWYRMWMRDEARPPRPMITGSARALSELDAACSVT